MRIPSLVFALLAMSQAALASASEPATLASLPEPVRALLAARHGEIGDAGAPFSAWCVRAAGTYHARLVSIEAAPERILVRFERGGIAGPLQVRAEFRIEDGKWTEPGMAPPPPPYVPPVRWTGQPRRFTSPLDTVLPPLTAGLTPSL